MSVAIWSFGRSRILSKKHPFSNNTFYESKRKLDIPLSSLCHVYQIIKFNKANQSSAIMCILKKVIQGPICFKGKWNLVYLWPNKQIERPGQSAQLKFFIVYSTVLNSSIAFVAWIFNTVHIEQNSMQHFHFDIRIYLLMPQRTQGEVNGYQCSIKSKVS